jgi:hypothetical protein
MNFSTGFIMVKRSVKLDDEGAISTANFRLDIGLDAHDGLPEVIVLSPLENRVEPHLIDHLNVTDVLIRVLQLVPF